ncbi:hypothetical protein ACFE04_002479 [Oxalis oulophora]
MLSSNIKGVANGFPLTIQVEKTVTKEVDFNPEFLRHIFTKLEWKALVDAAKTMGYTELPEETPTLTEIETNDDLLRKLNHALLELHLEEGALLCPETGRKFTVSKGIPNMLLNEDEV